MTRGLFSSGATTPPNSLLQDWPARRSWDAGGTRLPSGLWRAWPPNSQGPDRFESPRLTVAAQGGGGKDGSLGEGRPGRTVRVGQGRALGCYFHESGVGMGRDGGQSGQ